MPEGKQAIKEGKIFADPATRDDIQSNLAHLPATMCRMSAK